MSLHGKTILITRREEQSEEMVAAIQRRGGTPVVIPMIAVTEPDDWTACDEAMRHMTEYDAVLFVSANAVEGFLRRFKLRCGGVFGDAGLEVYAVGEKTKIELEKKGIGVEFVPDTFSAHALMTHFRTQNLSGRKILLPKGNLGSEELSKELESLGAVVNAFEVYNTVPPDAKSKEELRNRILASEFDVVTFASPSAVQNFADAVPAKMYQQAGCAAKIAVIGPTTKDAALKAGFAVDIEATISTASGLVESIEQYFS